MKRIFLVFMYSLLVILTLTASSLNLESQFEVRYILTLEKDDYPKVEVHIKNSPSTSTKFIFGLVKGGVLGAISDLSLIFKDFSVESNTGEELKWAWQGDREIVVSNGVEDDFVLKYQIDALNYGRDLNYGSEPRFVFFRAKRIFFIAGDVFIMPESTPSKIMVDSILPERTELFSSLEINENGTHISKIDLWNNISYDFQKTYFTGGEVLFSLTHFTDWGDKYIYLWFDRDVTDQAWLPSYEITPWEQAEKYMKDTEACARYYRDHMGVLPPHTVLFTNVIPSNNEFPGVQQSMSWFHYMQIWPENSIPEVCHHVFHQYSFALSQSKLPLAYERKYGNIFGEGLPTYFENTIPQLIGFGDYYRGKLFEYYVLNERGQEYGIRENQMHQTITSQR